MAKSRKPRELADYFTMEEAQALVTAIPNYQARMVTRIMLRTGLRVSEALSLCPADFRLNQHPPVISVRADIKGNKAKRGREVPVPADVVEFLRDMASMHGKDRHRPLFDISRQWVSACMKRAADEAGLDRERVHPHAMRHTYGRHAVLSGIPLPVLQSWLGHRSLEDTERYVVLAGTHHSWVEKI